MKPGSVIVDLAAERGGNCELTRADERVEAHGVLDPRAHQPRVDRALPRKPDVREEHDDVPAAPGQGQGARHRHDDEITRETLVTHAGEVVHPRVREALGLPAAVRA